MTKIIKKQFTEINQKKIFQENINNSNQKLIIKLQVNS